LSALPVRARLRHAGGALRNRRVGVAYALTAYGIWGVLPLYLKALHAVPALEVVAHRIVWSALLLLLLIALTQEWSWLRQVRERPRLVWMFVASAAGLSINWLTYIWAVNVGRVVDASLGYFINPLFSVVLAVLVLKERLRAGQWAAVAVACLGVLWLTLQAGQPPWIGIILAVCFGLYGLFRKMASIDALGGLALETWLLLPLAGGYLLYLALTHQSSWATADTTQNALLVAAGPITAVPLLAFAAAARRIPLSLIGILQYVGPTLQLALGALVFHEPLPAGKLFGFALIWLALALYAFEGLMFRGRPADA
jgi:chloramphenicol-sensitive protein RarD